MTECRLIKMLASHWVETPPKIIYTPKPDPEWMHRMRAQAILAQPDPIPPPCLILP
ncbi:hypothetical protein LCGC14_1536970 [marine sediment metagenome]|uniref:Uncharacterized protein n=1 Tax=marine sediment metagenome TaxID=412755 RepID=A0A0F9JF55_9ZZZZ